MATQRIIQGDCLNVFANERNIEAFVSDPPANIGFMGRSWDKSQAATDYVLPCKPRSKAHESILRKKESFIRYWYERYAMAYDVADQHATALIWTLPQTSHQTAEAMERAGWEIKANIVHLFGSGWMKVNRTNSDGERVPAALAPGQEGWLLCTKGKPDLDIDACRVPRGGGIYGSGAGAGSGNIANQTGNGRTRGGGVGIVAESDPRGSLPKNALLSHCEECVPVGVKRVKGGSSINHNRDPRAFVETAAHGKIRKVTHDMTYTDDGKTESVPAWHCLAGCVCGASTPWPDDRPLPRCPCGEVWRWRCAVAEVNAQSGILSTHGGGATMALGYGGTSDPIIRAHPKGDQGGASRFFNTFSYLAKCSSSERHVGCENLFWKANKKNPFGFDQVTKEEWESLSADERAQGNVHPTVKSYRLMHWLHSLTGAKRIGDLCGGSGTGMIAARINNADWIGAEMCPEAVTIANARHAFWSRLSLSALVKMLTDGDTNEAIRLHDRYLDAVAAE